MPRTTPPALRTARSYWLGLSVAFGLGLGCFAALPSPWHWVSTGVVILFLLGQAAMYGQVKPALQGKFAINSASFGLLVMILVVAAVVSRDSAFAVLLGIAVGLLGAISMFWVLVRRGRFYPKEPRST
ncbi:hypothetical protein [Arthrobacter sp. NPDC090010]|uniref:hypothetical protein n=1 Tax=Arthrobacter sp. NPDC090010 TaxID=3363942 RepID=UPI003820B4DC